MPVFWHFCCRLYQPAVHLHVSIMVRPNAFLLILLTRDDKFKSCYLSLNYVGQLQGVTTLRRQSRRSLVQIPSNTTEIQNSFCFELSSITPWYQAGKNKSLLYRVLLRRVRSLEFELRLISHRELYAFCPQIAKYFETHFLSNNPQCLQEENKLLRSILPQKVFFVSPSE